MSSTTTTVSAQSPPKPPESKHIQSKYSKPLRIPGVYYYLVLLSPLIIGLSFILLGLFLILTGVLLILAAPAFLIVGLFMVPRDVTPEDHTWGWKFLLDRNAEGFREWVRERYKIGVDLGEGGKVREKAD
ncbi:hypothetical protein TWF481_006376 [Arthrobotrys musiformis]|uniref:Uncharacterized protein n=1 Tax=Arthrobotrys musiformis TaxID=47236 RepID=A0AAV9WGK2_9PEZI